MRAGCADSVSGARRWLAYTGGFRARVCGRLATLLLSLAVRPYKGVFPALIRVHRVGRRARGAHAFLPSPPTPFPLGAHYTTVFGRTGSEADFTPLLQVPPAGGGNQTAVPLAKQGEPNGADKGTSLEFTVCEARTLFRPHPQPLSHSVGEGCRGARRCALQRVPPLPQAGEGDTGGEGNTAHLPVHACAGKNSPCFKDFVPNRCTLTRRAGVGANGC